MAFQVRLIQRNGPRVRQFPEHLPNRTMFSRMDRFPFSLWSRLDRTTCLLWGARGMAAGGIVIGLWLLGSALWRADDRAAAQRLARHFLSRLLLEELQQAESTLEGPVRLPRLEIRQVEIQGNSARVTARLSGETGKIHTELLLTRDSPYSQWNLLGVSELQAEVSEEIARTGPATPLVDSESAVVPLQSDSSPASALQSAGAGTVKR